MTDESLRAYEVAFGITPSRRDQIFAVVGDAVTDLVVYDRKNSTTLPLGAIEHAIADGEITVDEIVNEFRTELLKALD